MKIVFPRLYAIMDAALFSPESRFIETKVQDGELAFAEMLAQAGVALIQYRNKQDSSRRLWQISSGLSTRLRAWGCRFIVNDRADVAAACGADGVHVGQEDLPVEAARRVCGSGRWVGVSTHTLAQVEAAERTSADYVAVGPVFATSTKERADPVVGVEFVLQARGITRKPLVAVGGITLDRAEEVWRAGADCLAVAADLLRAENPAARARLYLDLAARL